MSHNVVRRRPSRRYGRVAGVTAALSAAVAALAGCSSSPSAQTKASTQNSPQGSTAQAIAPQSSVSQMAASGSAGTGDQGTSMSSVCGSKKIKVAFAVGIGDNGWRQTTKAALEDEAKKCPNITGVLYTDAGGDTGKAISDINGLVAQGVNAIVVMPDAGASLLPTLRSAYQHGVAVVPFGSPAGGTPGKDYNTFVGPDEEGMGKTWAQWMVQALHGQGNVLFLGGVAGNKQSLAEADGIKSVFASASGMKLLAGPVDTGWTVAGAQKEMAGALSKYGKIDGVITDYGGDAIGAIHALQSAGRPLVPMTATDENDFACAYQQYSGSNPAFQIQTVTSFNYMVRIAVRQAVAAAEGVKDSEPTTIENPVFEDSLTSGKAPQCKSSLPPSSILSSGLDDATLQRLGNGG